MEMDVLALDIKYIPLNIKNLYKTVWEISRRAILNIAEDCCTFIIHPNNGEPISLSTKSVFHLKVDRIEFGSQLKFLACLFIPERAPVDSVWKRKSIRLLGDSQDLPLNISCEIPQQSKLLKIICKNLVKKCVELFNELAKDKNNFKKCYNQFSKNIKLSKHKDSTNPKKLVSLLNCCTTACGEKLCSLDGYVSRVKENQKDLSEELKQIKYIFSDKPEKSWSLRSAPSLT